MAASPRELGGVCNAAFLRAAPFRRFPHALDCGMPTLRIRFSAPFKSFARHFATW